MLLTVVLSIDGVPVGCVFHDGEGEALEWHNEPQVI